MRQELLDEARELLDEVETMLSNDYRYADAEANIAQALQAAERRGEEASIQRIAALEQDIRERDEAWGDFRKGVQPDFRKGCSCLFCVELSKLDARLAARDEKEGETT